jgi:hypothetical protein
MLRFVAGFLQGVLVFMLLVSTVLAYFAMTSTPRRKTNESPREAGARLWVAYRVQWRVAVSSPFFWGAAGLATALIIFVNR